jgi:hypothetical protein
VEDFHLILGKVLVGRLGGLAHICQGQWISQAKHSKKNPQSAFGLLPEMNTVPSGRRVADE